MNRNAINSTGFPAGASMRISFRLKTLLLINSLLIAITSLASCRSISGVSYSALFLTLLAISAVIDLSGRFRPPRLALNLISVAIFCLVVIRVRIGNFVIVLTESLLMMCAIKLMENKQSRDYQQIAMLSAFTILSAGAEMPDETNIYLGVIFSLLAGFQFILSAWFAQDPDASLAPGEISMVVRRAMSIWVLMLPMCLLMFFAAPRAFLNLGGSLQARSNTAYIGFSDRISLGSVSAIQEKRTLAFRAEMPLVAPRFLYWRGLVLDSYNGSEWFAASRRAESPALIQSGSILRQIIFLENSGRHRTVFAIDVPIMINNPGVRQVADGSFMNVNHNQVRRYEAFSSLSDTITPQSGRIRRNHYLSLPDNFSPAIRELTEDILSGVDDREKPEALMRYLLNAPFSYSLSGLPVSSEPLEEFLLRTQSGNCEYYATAMAVMLRIGGVPSRIVAGYRGGVYNENGNYYMVHQSDAHVWVEAWDNRERLWRRYDPTPALTEEAGGVGDTGVGGVRVARYSLLYMYIDYINLSVLRIFLEYTGDSRSQLFDTVRGFFTSPAGAMVALRNYFMDDKRRAHVTVIAAAGICLVVIIKLFCRRGNYRVRRSKDERLRDGFLEAMNRRGFMKMPNEGLEEFVEGVAFTLGKGDPVMRAAADFVISFETFYFKDMPITPLEFKRLKGIVRDIKRAKRAK